ncbi:MAG: sulfotransferase, partial [Myxococcota bacterium]|nr:sulfotransferase [Myxococcota bacterium]
MPEDIRILDLANPQLPQTFVDQTRAAAPMADALVLERDAVVTQASNETGLTDFGEDGWQERLDVVLQGLREDAELSPIGKLSGYAQLV